MSEDRPRPEVYRPQRDVVCEFAGGPLDGIGTGWRTDEIFTPCHALWAPGQGTYRLTRLMDRPAEHWRYQWYEGETP